MTGTGCDAAARRRRRAAYGGRAAGAAAAVLLLAGAAPAPAAPPPVAASPAPAPAVDDLYAVYCLAPEHRAATVAAAVRLGLARAADGHPDAVAGATAPAAPVPVARWAAGHPAGFRRVCAAVVAAARVPQAAAADGGGDGDGIGSSALLAAIGAGLTLLGGAVERFAGRRRTWVDGVRLACEGFQTEAERYLDAWVESPDADFAPVRTARAALGTLLRMPPGRSRRAEAARLAATLPLGERPAHTRAGGPTGAGTINREGRQARALELTDATHTAVSRAGELVRGWPVRLWNRLRDDPPAAGGGRGAGRAGGAAS